MNRLNLISNIPCDKLGHFAAGVVIYAVAHFVSPLFGISVVALAAVGKEIYDYLHREKHTPDLMDAAATIAGGFMAFVAGI